MDESIAAQNSGSSEPRALSRAQDEHRRMVVAMWAMVVVALIIRLVVMRFAYANLLDPARDHYLPGWENGHVTFGREYERIAKAIISGQGFSSPYPYPTGPTALVGPVYGYLLAGIFKLFGALTTASTLAALTVNNLLSSLICVPIVLIARRAFGSRIARWSGWAWVFYPHAIAGSNSWVWDTVLGTLLLTLLVLYTLKLEHSNKYLAWLGYGLLWAVAALTNANALSVLPFFGGWIFFRQWKSGALRMGPIIAASLIFLAGVAPWIYRSSQLYGRFVAFRGNFGLEVIVGNSSDTSEPSNWNETPGSNLAQLQEFVRLGEPAYMAEKQREAAQVMKERPLWFAGQSLRRISIHVDQHLEFSSAVESGRLGCSRRAHLHGVFGAGIPRIGVGVCPSPRTNHSFTFPAAIFSHGLLHNASGRRALPPSDRSDRDDLCRVRNVCSFLPLRR